MLLVSMLEQWQCAQHRMRTVRRRTYAAHLTVCRSTIEQLEQVEIDAFPASLVNRHEWGFLPAVRSYNHADYLAHMNGASSRATGAQKVFDIGLTRRSRDTGREMLPFAFIDRASHHP